MRKIHFVLAALSAAVLCLMTACGASKKVSIENPDGVALANDPCVDLCMQSPYTRAYGKGTHFKEMTARNIAELQANAMYARKIEKAVLSATEDLGISLGQYAGDDNTGRSVSDHSGESNDLAALISQQVIRDMHVIKTSRYYGKNNQYTVYVCVEYGGDKDTLVKQIEQKVKDRISDEDRAKIESRHDEFKDIVYGKLKEN